MKTDFEIGKLYNITYVGDNDAYGRINGKRTIEIISVEGNKIQFYELYSCIGSCTDKWIRSNTITATLPYCFENDMIEKTTIDNCYVHHIVSTLPEIMEKGLVSIEDLKWKFRNQEKYYIREHPLTHHGKGIISYKFAVEDKCKENPLLQRVSVIWNSEKEALKELQQYYPEAWV